MNMASYEGIEAYVSKIQAVSSSRGCMSLNALKGISAQVAQLTREAANLRQHAQGAEASEQVPSADSSGESD